MNFVRNVVQLHADFILGLVQVDKVKSGLDDLIGVWLWRLAVRRVPNRQCHDNGNNKQEPSPSFQFLRRSTYRENIISLDKSTFSNQSSILSRHIPPRSDDWWRAVVVSRPIVLGCRYPPARIMPFMRLLIRVKGGSYPREEDRFRYRATNNGIGSARLY